MTVHVTPLRDRILVRRLEEKEIANGNDIKIDDQEYLILREEEILAKLNMSAKAASGKK